MSYTTRETCRVCGSKDLITLFSLGEHYVNNFVNADREGEGDKCPIELELCGNCTLVQMKHTAPQAILYERFYWYRSGVTQTMRDALEDIVDSIYHRAGLRFPPNEQDTVLDIGSNDGTLLRCYRPEVRIEHTPETIGVEPADNLQEEGAEGIDFLIHDFWSFESYTKAMGYKKAKVVTAIGMFYDLEDPNKFIGDIAKVLALDGIFVTQLMCLRDMFKRNDIGNLAHEHLEFYSLASLEYLFSKHGLEIYDIEFNDVNGASTRLYVRHIENTLPARPKGGKQRLELAREQEAREEYDLVATYYAFFSKMESNRYKVVTFIEDEVDKGKTVWVYGASTKGNTILQYYGLDTRHITGAAEKSPEKFGKYTVGSMIPIVSEVEARAAMPDYFLVLPYAFIDEFVEREKDEEWRKAGGKFIVPLPEFHLV